MKRLMHLMGPELVGASYHSPISDFVLLWQQTRKMAIDNNVSPESYILFCILLLEYRILLTVLRDLLMVSIL